VVDGLAWEGIAKATLAAFEMVASFAPRASAEPAVTTLERAPHEQRI